MALRSLTPVAITALPNASTPLSGTEAVAIVQSGTTSQVAVSDLTAGRAVSASALTASSGNLTFTGTAQRITGDFSNATVANRLAFQTSTVNGNSGLFILPNGTGTTSSLQIYPNSDPTNSAFLQVRAATTLVGLNSAINGTGTFLPMTFETGGSERMRIDASGNVGIGTASPVNTAGYTTLQLNNSVSGGMLRVSNGTQTYWNYVNSGGGYLGMPTADPLIFQTNNTDRMRIDASGNIVAGASAALATNATNGFLYVPTCAGTPTGTPTAITGMAPIVVNTTNNKLYFYSGGAWRDAGP